MIRDREIVPDVIFLDIGLPGMDGYEVAERLHREPPAYGARLFALTGYGEEEDRRRAERAGFDGYLTKPVGADELMAALRGGSSRGARGRGRGAIRDERRSVAAGGGALE